MKHLEILGLGVMGLVVGLIAFSLVEIVFIGIFCYTKITLALGFFPVVYFIGLKMKECQDDGKGK